MYEELQKITGATDEQVEAFLETLLPSERILVENRFGLAAYSDEDIEEAAQSLNLMDPEKQFRLIDTAVRSLKALLKNKLMISRN